MLRRLWQTPVSVLYCHGWEGFTASSLQHQGHLTTTRLLTGLFSTNSLDGLKIRESAVTRIKQLQKEKSDDSLFLRIEVEGGGCSGYQYKFAIDREARDDDIVIASDGANVVCDTTSFEFLKGATLEYEDSLMRSAFVIASNPNSESSCGCGSSFTAKIKL